MKVLVVEDDPSIAEGLQALLALEDIDSMVIAEGRLAVGAVAKYRPVAVILDVGLPDMDGLSVCRQLIAAYPDLPIIFSTGRGDESSLDESLKRPNIGYLTKPYSLDALMAALNKLLR